VNIFEAGVDDCHLNNPAQHVADELRDALVAQHGSDGAMLRLPDDVRVRRVSRLIRRISSDKIPQLINVLKGEMSLVGPQPHMQRRVPATRTSRSANSTSGPG